MKRALFVCYMVGEFYKESKLLHIDLSDSCSDKFILLHKKG